MRGKARRLPSSFAVVHPSSAIVALLKGVYKAPRSTPPEAKVETKNHHKTMIFGVPEAEILRTPIKIEKLSVWSVTFSEFIVNFEFHGFLEKKLLFEISFFCFFMII